MYEEFFALRQRPFTPAPQVSRYFPAETIELARGTVARCLDRSEGVALVVGPSGTGKTLLCQMLRARLDADSSVVMLCCGRLTSLESLYQTILFQLGRPYRGMSENELRLDLVNYLTDVAIGEQRLILLIDEAHTLSLKLLDEIRMLTNAASHLGEPHVRVLLSGSPLLEERFTHPKLEPFSQRITTRCYLESFRQEETRQYIHAQIDAVGGDGTKLFTTKATKAVFQATDGNPRLINQLCDHALLFGAQEGKTRIDEREVEIAWADLQQLPTPWNDEPVDSASVIEFGTLDDAPCGASISSSSKSKTISHKNTTTDDLLADLTVSSSEPSEVGFPEEDFSKEDCLEEQLPEPTVSLDPQEVEETIETILADLLQDPQPEPEKEKIEIISVASKPSLDSAGNPFSEEFESEEEVVQPLGVDVGRSPMVVPVDSPLLTYTPREVGSEEMLMTSGIDPLESVEIAIESEFHSESTLEGAVLVELGYPHAPPSMREKLTLFSPDAKDDDDTDVTVNRRLSRIFAALRRA